MRTPTTLPPSPHCTVYTTSQILSIPERVGAIFMQYLTSNLAPSRYVVLWQRRDATSRWRADAEEDFPADGVRDCEGEAEEVEGVVPTCKICVVNIIHVFHWPQNLKQSTPINMFSRWRMRGTHPKRYQRSKVACLTCSKRRRAWLITHSSLRYWACIDSK